MTRTRATAIRTRSLALLVAVGAALTLFGAGPALAAGYRYWSFWESGKGSWAYATEGPATARPADGSVNGFRFAVSEDSGDAAKPRTAPDFAAICGKTPAKDGSKRVGVVVDFGTPQDSATGEQPPAQRTACAQVPSDASAADALAAVAKPLRYDSKAMLCAISGYPGTGCGEQVADTPKATEKGTDKKETPAAQEKDGGSGPSVGLIAGVAAVVVLGAGAVWQARRRRG
ncbi:SCO2322 family protein [Streptomyces sp. NPDC001941]|uniref:SCO2322 family protein n=1 Tax=Streptomyces sp. NPDC001941 TaxID=3154659 RepID=UPI0033177084